MSENTIGSSEILIHVQGGGSISGDSGKLILQEISSILREVEKSAESKVKIGVDTSYFKSQIQSAINEINAQIASSEEQTSASVIAANQSAHQIKIQNMQSERASEMATNAFREQNYLATNDRIKQSMDSKTQHQIANDEREKASSLKKTDIELAGIQSVQFQATKYYESHKDKINANADLLSRYNKIMSGDFSNSAAARSELNSWKTACVSAKVETKSLGDTVKDLWGKYGGLIAQRLIVDGVMRAARQAIQEIQDLDKAVVNLSMVTGYSREKTQELLDTYVEMGKRIGATTSEVADAANEWLRQGYSIEETNKLVESSVILSKVGMLESADATQYLTSALKGYKVDIADAMDIVDKMTSVDMKAAISTAGLAEAMSKTANSARLAGVDMNRLLGYIAAVGEVTQADPASVGTSFKTMFSRLSNIKLGKLEDENGEDITQSLNDAEEVLNRVNIRLRDTATSYRNFGDVFDEIAAKWNSFNDIERNTIAMAFGGTRQKEQILTLFENYGNALSYAETAANSAGTAMQKYDAYVSGIEKSVKSFQATWESFINNLVSSDFAKGIVDFGAGAINFLDTLTKIKVLLPSIISLLLTWKNVGERMIENAGLCTLRKCA